MHPSYIIIENFYVNPFEVLHFAMKQDFLAQKYDLVNQSKYSLNCNYTHSFSSLIMRELIQSIIGPIAGNITHFDTRENNPYTLNGSFHITNIATKPMVNVLNNNQQNTWIGIVFLNPESSVNTGISLCKHVSIDSNNIYPNISLNRIESILTEKERFDYTKWNVVDFIGSVFNRMVCFRANSYHRYDFPIIQAGDSVNVHQFFIFNTEH